MAGKGRFFEDINKLREAITLYGPQFIGALGDAGENIIRNAARQAGMLQPATRGALPQATRAAAQAAPRAASEAAQLRLPLSSVTRSEGRFVSPYGPKISPADIDARLAVQNRPSIQDVEALRAALRRPESPGQMNIFSAPEPAFKTTPMQGPISRTAQDLYANDPGTYQSIDALAKRASAFYGKPVSVDDLVSPRGTAILNDLDLATRGGGLAPQGPAGLATRAPGGPLVESPAGRMTEYQRGALARQMQAAEPAGVGRAYQSEPFIDVPFEEIRNAAGGLKTLDLRKVAAAGALGGLAFGGLMSRMGQPEYQTGQATQSVDSPLPQGDLPAAPSITQDPGTLGVPGSANVGFGPVGGQIGAGQVVITTPRSRARDEALNEAIQNAQAAAGLTKPQSDLLRYYQQREAYAEYPSNKTQIVKEFTAQGGRYGQPDMAAWASANPELAFELMQKMKGKLPSQQMPQAQQISQPVTEMGADTQRNALGNAQSAGVAATMGDQGSFDLQQATTPYYPVQIGNPGYNMYGYPLINQYR